MISVVFTGGKQYIVRSGDKLKVEKLTVNEGEKVNLDKVLLSANEDGTDLKVGAPYVEGAKVSATALKQGKERTLRVEKFKRKVRFHKVHGQRQRFTELQVA